MEFKKATKKASKLRAAIAAPAGGGKTLTALKIAKGIGGKVALIDTEFKTASKYSDRYDFDVLELSNETPIPEFIEAIRLAGDHGYSTLIIDSMSHAWESLLDAIEKVAKGKYNGNTFAAWKDKAGGQMQSDFINAILKSPMHIIACFRVKTEWVVEPNDKGKMIPKRIGMSVKQREGIEYEFDIFLEGNIEHYFTITKDRTGKFQDQVIEKPDESFGKQLIDWLNEGEKLPDLLPNTDAWTKAIDWLKKGNKIGTIEIKYSLNQENREQLISESV
jgi:hypothetical protein